MPALKRYLIFNLLVSASIALSIAACTGGTSTNASFPTTQESDLEDDERPSKPTPKPDKPDEPCHYNGHQLHIGKRGGCYYLYDGKKKEYVDRTYCDSCPQTTKSSKRDSTKR